MTSTNNQPSPDTQNSIEEPLEESPNIQNFESTPSATTTDIPSFGWSSYAERINGRFAMIGFIAILLIELLSQESFLHWAGF